MDSAAGCLDPTLCDILLQYTLARDALWLRVCARDYPLSKAVREDWRWRPLFRRVFGGDGAPDGPEGEATGSWFRAFRLWWAAARSLGLREPLDAVEPLPARWFLPWLQLRRWLAAEAPQVRETLRPGAESVEECRTAHLAAGHTMPAAEFSPLVRGLWEVCDGQSTGLAMAGFDLPVLSENEQWSLGLLGGYSFYDHEISMRLLPIRSCLKLTALIEKEFKRFFADGKERKMAFACSHTLDKILLVDVQDGSVHVFLFQGRRPRLEPLVEFQPCSPDGLLRWFSSYTRNLQEGLFTMRMLKPEHGPSTRGISVFPTRGLGFSRCVTHGVEVSASCIYTPEVPQGWCYSVSLALVGSAADRGFDTCQLHMRHWEIEDDRGEVDRVDGEAVIGFKPILCDGGWLLNAESDPHGQYLADEGIQHGPFTYQSCTGRNAGMRGRFSGWITFVPGTIRQPAGDSFKARLDTFEFSIPDTVF